MIVQVSLIYKRKKYYFVGVFGKCMEFLLSACNFGKIY